MATREINDREIQALFQVLADVKRAVLETGEAVLEENPGEAGKLLNAMRAMTNAQRRFIKALD